jgi:hypothetical protein
MWGLKRIGVLMDNTIGLQVSDVIYVNTNTEQIESLPATAVHRSADMEIVGADKDGQSHFQLVSRDWS